MHEVLTALQQLTLKHVQNSIARNCSRVKHWTTQNQLILSLPIEQPKAEIMPALVSVYKRLLTLTLIQVRFEKVVHTRLDRSRTDFRSHLERFCDLDRSNSCTIVSSSMFLIERTTLVGFITICQTFECRTFHVRNLANRKDIPPYQMSQHCNIFGLDYYSECGTIAWSKQTMGMDHGS